MTTPRELRLKRFIHFASEAPTYLPGQCFKTELKLDSITSLDDFIADEKHADITNIILKAFTDSYSVRPDALIFALASAARQDKSEELRTFAYSTARTVCKDVDSLFMFVKFCGDMAPGKGFGKGLRKMVNDWYMKQDPLALLKSITECTKNHGWSHKNLLKVCHINSSKNEGIAAVLNYALRGFREMKLIYGNKPLVRPLIQYIQNLEDFWKLKSSNKEEIVKAIETNKYTLEQLIPKMYPFKATWTAFIPIIPLPVLLKNIRRLGYMRLINIDQPHVELVLKALANQENIDRSNLHPAEVLICRCNYERTPSLGVNVKKRSPHHKTPDKQLPLEVNPKIVEALNNLMKATFKLLVPTGQRYLVIVDVRPEMVLGKCYQNNSISPLTAAALITLSLVKTERSVTVGTFGNNGTVHTIRLGKNLGLQEAHDKFKSVVSCPVDFSQPINWAKNKAKEYDVFIMITDNQCAQLKMMAPSKALSQYRKKMRRPLAKLVVCGLRCVLPFNIADPADPGMLEIAGFNGKVPRVIEAFSRGAF